MDPPFKSDADYNVLFAEHSGSRAAAQIKAFEDTWTWDLSAARAYEEVVEAGGSVSLTLQAFRQILGESDIMAYLVMMAPRLVELRRVLKPNGTLYLREKADLGVMITLGGPTSPMKKEAAAAGFYTSPMGGKHPKVQILTIEQLLSGVRIEYPTASRRTDLTLRKALKVAAPVPASATLFEAATDPILGDGLSLMGMSEDDDE